MNPLTLRIIGFVGSLILTLLAYTLIIHPEYLSVEKTQTVWAIFFLAFLQFLVQFTFFLDLWREKGEYWNMGIFVSTVFVIVIIIAGSIWIMNHLNYNMIM